MVQYVYYTYIRLSRRLCVDLSITFAFDAASIACMLLFCSHLSWIIIIFFPQFYIGNTVQFCWFIVEKVFKDSYISFITYRSCEFITLCIACGCPLLNAAVFSLEIPYNAMNRYEREQNEVTKLHL